ncbi:hypothetical protein [Micromonospora sp. RTP1Z1]|uniref:hypothetical protein n=1 Tax=Micromonospora sp. RTP1Z1 TaxID=2994043 RepID=UPI0029C6897E|nr:hypothetical protein [Micromonospora sp. RTP1Z1]
MTAKSPAIDTVPSTAQPRWRITWSERENDRRRRAHDTATEVWHRRNDHLIRLQIEAAVFLGYTLPRACLPVDLDDDEAVYRVLPAADLVEAEARHVAGLPTPGLTVAAASVDAPGRALPTGLRVVDAGMAVVTSHRVAFSGRAGGREWRYADMVGPAHHPDLPVTLLHTTDGSRLAGLLVPRAATVNFRFYLTLAFAAATGQRAAVAAQTAALRDAHQRIRPAPPPTAQPGHAPLTALRPDRRVATVTAVVALIFATLPTGTFRTEPAGLPYRAAAGASRIATTTDAVHAIGPTAPRSPARPVVPDGGRDGPLTGAPGAGTADGPVLRQRTTSRATSAAATVAATAPAARPAPTTGLAPASPPAPTTGPSPITTPAPTGPAPTTTPPPTTDPAPTSGSPSPATALVDLCVNPLQRLLCPSATP